jgi:hypothetical protein
MIGKDAIVEFIETRKYLLLGVGAGFLLLIALLLGIALFAGKSSGKNASSRVYQAKLAAMKQDAFTPGDLFYPSEPLSVPGVQLSRYAKAQWTADDARRWYTIPDAASMEQLRRAGQGRIDALLESVP